MLGEGRVLKLPEYPTLPPTDSNQPDLPTSEIIAPMFADNHEGLVHGSRKFECMSALTTVIAFL